MPTHLEPATSGFSIRDLAIWRSVRPLVAEMQARGYAPQFTATHELLIDIPPEWCCDWEPSDEAMAINRARIAERLRK